jgi:Skp family chaperone for outer membrane proteins
MSHPVPIARIISATALASTLAAPPLDAQAGDATRVAAVNLAYIAQSSKAGKAGLARIEAAGRKRDAEAALRVADLRTQQAALERPGGVMSDDARARLQNAFEQSRLAFQRFQEDGEAELRGLQAEFEAGFRLKLLPVVDAVSKEKGLHFVFGLEQAAIVWWHSSLDISADVVERLDAAEPE